MTDKKKCSKQKEERTCGYKMYWGSCDRPLYDDEHCIFHSKDIEGKKEKFNDAFLKEFKRQKEHEEIYDFTGFVFPGDISFMGKTFEKDVHFREARFSKRAEFEEAKFSKRAEFEEAQFSGEADFSGSQFSREAGFGYAKFSERADFEEAKFSKVTTAYFANAQFSGIARFYEAQFSATAYFEKAQFSKKANFRCAQFSEKAYFGSAQFSGEAYFEEAQFSGEADFTKAKFKKEAMFNYIKIEKYNSFTMIDTYFYNVSGLFEFIETNKKKFKFSNKTEFLPDNFYLILGEEATARYPIISRKIRDDMYLLRFTKKHPKMHFIWWLFADCGRSFFRWALWSFGFAIAFAFIYYFSYTDYLLNFQTIYVSEDFPLFSFIYYSIVTFTTLGFGDIVPRSGWLQFWVMLEVILGYIMLGGLISILANKLARRS